MREWPVPPEIEDAHEKFLGPLGFRQFLYAIGGFVMGCLLGAMPVPVWMRVTGFFAGLLAGAVLALARFYDMDCDLFLIRLWKWWRSKKAYYLERGVRR